MTSLQAVREFGKDNCSPQIQTAYQRKDYSSEFDIYHNICPNDDYDPRSLLSRKKRFKSVYYETYGDNILRDSGYDDFPLIATVWEERPGDVYGGCPGMDALGAVNMLQTMEKDKLKAVKKEIDPPMIATSKLRDKKKSLVPGGVTYDDNLQNAGMRPVYQIQPKRLDRPELNRQHKQQEQSKNSKQPREPRHYPKLMLAVEIMPLN